MRVFRLMPKNRYGLYNESLNWGLLKLTVIKRQTKWPSISLSAVIVCWVILFQTTLGTVLDSLKTHTKCLWLALLIFQVQMPLPVKHKEKQVIATCFTFCIICISFRSSTIPGKCCNFSYEENRWTWAPCRWRHCVQERIDKMFQGQKTPTLHNQRVRTDHCLLCFYKTIHWHRLKQHCQSTVQYESQTCIWVQ